MKSNNVLTFPGVRGGGSGFDIPGGGDNSGGMEARIARLEAFAESTDKRLGLIEQDLRALRDKTDTGIKSISDKLDARFFYLLSAVVAGFLILAGAMWAGYSRLDNKIDTRFMKIDEMFQKLDAKSDAKFDKIIERLPSPPAAKP